MLHSPRPNRTRSNISTIESHPPPPSRFLPSVGNKADLSLTAPPVMNTSRPKTAAADQDPATAGALDVLIQSAPPHPALLGLDARQRLVLAQLVYQSHQQQPSGTGKINWQDVSHQLASHPVFASQTEEGKIPSVTLDATQCQLAWTVLMLERGLVDKSSSASTTTPMKDSRAQLALAQLLYVERVQDLEKTITSRENRYRCVKPSRQPNWN